MNVAVANTNHTAAASASATSWPNPAYAWYVIVLLNLSYLVAFADRIILGLLIVPIQNNLNLSDTEIGLISGIAFGVSYTVFALPAGYIGDRWSRRNLIVVGMTLWSLMTAACGLATNFIQLFLARAGVGIGEAVLHPASTSLIGDYFPPQRRARAFGLYIMAGAAGATFAFLVGGKIVQWLRSLDEITLPLIGPVEAWQATFIIVGLPGVLLAGLIYFTMREPERRGAVHAKAATSASWPEFRVFMRSNWRTFVCQGIGAPLLLTGGYSLMNWLPTMFERVHGWDAAQTSITYGLTGGIASILGAVASGMIADAARARGAKVATYLTCLIGGIGLNVFGCIAMVMPTPQLAMAGMTAASFFLLMPAVTSLACINEISPNRMRARIGAIYTFLVGLITNSLGPFGVGLITDHVFGDQNAINLSLLTLMSITGTAGAVLMIVGIKSYRRSVGQANAND
ncbi:MAG: MFS transporter [Rhodospirillaceae bacterium]|nr:MFS transporter [Rhodospirillaceae bacterium]